MSQNIVINSSHWDASQKKFIYKLRFPQTYSNKQIGLSSVSMYNQFFNVSASNGNNTVSIKWVNDITYTYVIADGYYSISEINSYLQNKMITDKLYMISSDGVNNVYFVEVLVDSNRYGSQLNLYTIPTISQATAKAWTVPANSSSVWTLSATVSKTPIITFNFNFGKLIGFINASYPSVSQTTDYTALSNKTPEISVVNNIIFRCNLINNLNIEPTDCLSAIPLTGSFGDQMNSSGGWVLYSDIATNTFNTIELSLSDQNGKSITLIDTECTIVLSIKSK